MKKSSVRTDILGMSLVKIDLYMFTLMLINIHVGFHHINHSALSVSLVGFKSLDWLYFIYLFIYFVLSKDSLLPAVYVPTSGNT